MGAITISDGSPTISRNDITGMISAATHASVIIENNKIDLQFWQDFTIYVARGTAIISNNILNGGGVGNGPDNIAVSSATITDNLFFNCSHDPAINLLESEFFSFRG